MAQHYPDGYFQSPMDTPLYLSAPFGSLRDNHFHSGMDIRTYEQEGLPVYAIADGYISRIKYSSVGYGKAIYINHLNGYTSVYGHLKQANGAVAEYIKKYQYEIEQFEFDHFPGRDQIKVTKGDIIGWSGNSGGSTGPHLHFEIRNTKTEEIINPQLFGIPVVDEQVPAILTISTFTFAQSGSKLMQQIPITTKNTIQTDSGFLLLDTILIPQQLTGFGIDAVDFLVGRNKEYSIYGMDLTIDDKKYYQFRLDRFHFNDSRCINVHIDYALYKSDGRRVQKLFVDDGNTISLYPYLRNKGRYIPQDLFTHKAMFTVYDFLMRKATVYAIIKATSAVNQLPEIISNAVICHPQKTVTFQNAFAKITVPEKALFDTLAVQYELLSASNEMLFATHRIHNPSTPLRKAIRISLKIPENCKPEWYPKLLLAYASKDNNWRSAGGEFENGFITTQSSAFGNFAITIDTIPPVITPLFKVNASTVDTTGISFRIKDDFSGINSYRLRINSKWVLAEYDAKNDELNYFFDGNTPPEKLNIELTVSDKKANTSIFTIDYSRAKIFKP